MRPAIVCRIAAVVAVLLYGVVPARAQCTVDPPAPTISPGGGAYDIPSVTVSITAAPGSFVSYTTNGTSPIPSGASSSPLTLTRTTTVTAAAWCSQPNAGTRWSPVNPLFRRKADGVSFPNLDYWQFRLLADFAFQLPRATVTTSVSNFRVAQ